MDHDNIMKYVIGEELQMPEFDVYIRVIEDWTVRIEADTAEKAEDVVRNGNIDMDEVDGNYDYRKLEVCGSDPI